MKKLFFFFLKIFGILKNCFYICKIYRSEFIQFLRGSLVYSHQLVDESILEKWIMIEKEKYLKKINYEHKK